MTKTQLLDAMAKLGACNEAIAFVEKSKKRTAKAIWYDCERGDWMLWLASKAHVDRKIVVAKACLYARQSLRFVRAGEDRPRLAIEAADRWTRGEATIEEVIEARNAAAAANAAYAANVAYAAAYAANVANAAYAAANVAYAYAAAAAANVANASFTRGKSLAESALLVRSVISWDCVQAALEVAR